MGNRYWIIRAPGVDARYLDQYGRETPLSKLTMVFTTKEKAWRYILQNKMPIGYYPVAL